MKKILISQKDNEGHTGYRIDQIAEEAEKSIPFQPNLILIKYVLLYLNSPLLINPSAGTNDATQKYTTNKAGERMDSLITRLYDAIPGTTIVLSTLLPNKLQPQIVTDISNQYRKIIARRRFNGDKIIENVIK